MHPTLGALTFEFSILTSSITAMSPLLLFKHLEPKDALGSEKLLVSERLCLLMELRQGFSSAAAEDEDGCFFKRWRFPFHPPVAEGRTE